MSLAPPQPSIAVGCCNQRLIGSSTSMETKQMCFLADGVYRNNSPGCLLELLAFVDHWFGAVLLNFFGHHSSRQYLSISLVGLPG